jgi:hypothetical protein
MSVQGKTSSRSRGSFPSPQVCVCGLGGALKMRAQGKTSSRSRGSFPFPAVMLIGVCHRIHNPHHSKLMGTKNRIKDIHPYLIY